MFKYKRNKFGIMKKGDLAWDFLGKILLALVVLFLIIIIAWLMRDKLNEVIQNFPKLFFSTGR